jgi:two-component system cell cycle response regulator
VIHLANILITAADPLLGQENLERLLRHGYQCRVVCGLDATVTSVRDEPPDVILAVGDFATDKILDLPGRLQDIRGGADVPLCLAPLTRSPDANARAVAAGIDDVVLPPLNEEKLIGRLRPLVRLAIMRAELHLRAGIARRFGVKTEGTVAPIADDEGCPLLVVGDCSTELRDALSDSQPTFVTDLFAAEEMLSASDVDAAVFVVLDDPGPYLDFCARLRNNPRLFNLPVVFIGGSQVIDETVAYRRGANGVFTQPIDPAELKSALFALVRQQRLRRAIRQALSDTLQQPTRDLAVAAYQPSFLEAYLSDRVKSPEQATRDLSASVYSRPFFDAYLAERVRSAQSEARHLSVMHFRLLDLEALDRSFGTIATQHLRSQVAQWITGLLRSEDLTGRYEADELCVVLPDTPKEEADIVMGRIAGVLAYTDFAVLGVYQPVKAWVRSGSAALRPDDTPETLIQRARCDME